MRFPLLRRALRAFALLLAPLAPAAQAQQTFPTPRPNVTVPLERIEARTLRPALWKVSDADTTIWLFGTIHALPKGLDWLNGPVAAAFDHSAELVTELPDVDPAAVQALVLEKGTLPQGQTLRGAIGPADAARVEAALARLKLPPAALDRLKPWYAAIVLGSVPLSRSGITGQQGVEDALAARAKAQGKPRAGLETMAQQLDMFDRLPLAKQKDLLREAVDGGDTVKALGEMVDDWGRGDVPALAAALADSELEGVFAKALVADRNRAWADWVAARLDKPGEVFVAVGAGHLAGTDSLIEALPRRGIAVTRVQ
ncbi:TraB/GumN family protein [Parablastomonas sp. CN1-191]|uniref:TraB/GumN family protein n=1 Tax=Parablastomonas sp. CN1-191 TaxID=3400908 RepID=UPI003BF8DBA9